MRPLLCRCIRPLRLHSVAGWQHTLSQSATALSSSGLGSGHSIAQSSVLQHSTVIKAGSKHPSDSQVCAPAAVAAAGHPAAAVDTAVCDAQEAIAHEYFEDIRIVATGSTGNLAALLRLHSSGDLQTMEVEAAAAAAGVTVGGGDCVGGSGGGGLQHQVSQVGDLGTPAAAAAEVAVGGGGCIGGGGGSRERLQHQVPQAGDLDSSAAAAAAGVTVGGGSCAGGCGGGSAGGGLQHQVSHVGVLALEAVLREWGMYALFELFMSLRRAGQCLHSSGNLQTIEVEATAAAAGVTVGCGVAGGVLQHQVGDFVSEREAVNFVSERAVDIQTGLCVHC